MWGLRLEPALNRTDLLADAVVEAIREWGDGTAFRVAEIDPALADTAAFCERYEVPLAASANCVVVAAKRGGTTRLAACVVLATTRADVNGVLRRHLEARKASFAPRDRAVAETGMDYGGITPFGLPPERPVLIDTAVVEEPYVVVGSGLRRSKLVVPGPVLAEIAQGQVLRGLAA